jgi:tyrosyl-DNA phosphodiesterase-1
VAAYLPDVFGTHHSKMMILFRHDDYVQVVIHTANMISKDWANMTQAVWRSPLLPLRTPLSPPSSSQPETGSHPIGSGERFKVDLLQYLAKYENRLRDLTGQLIGYDFSAVRAAFIGSAPSRQKPNAAESARRTSFGWLGLKEILSTVPACTAPTPASPHIVAQISSIATLGPTTKWLSNFQSVLAHSSHSKSTTTSRAPKFNIVFPTAEEIRTSLDGYASGGSIHMKVQSAQQQKQLEYSRPLFCHWKHPSPPSNRREAHRGPAAPHIKTYIRFTDEHDKRIDWAMVTSANLSKQAWGEVPNKDNEVRIQSYETGVVVWPGLFADSSGAETTMVPVFGKDTPAHGDVKGVVEKAGTDDDNDETEDEETEDEDEAPPAPSTPRPPHAKPPRSSTSASAGATASTAQTSKFIGFRMPYDLPLSRYEPGDEPWCASMPDPAPDWMGRRWTG